MGTSWSFGRGSQFLFKIPFYFRRQLKKCARNNPRLNWSTYLAPLSFYTCAYKSNSYQIAFAKTHKTGSSTFQNILFRWEDVKCIFQPTSSHQSFRFGDERNLTFAIPEKSWMYSFKESFHHSMIRWVRWNLTISKKFQNWSLICI